ncbi:DUF305 domain-containing protein [Kineococcus sp. SYSU DK003]|uniref:DUF305 domain-containing protein n=1 Tax=Kineococcus sp. SYSU DK003 TaxID=3383124 RepID=UPI003D7E3D9E
MAALSARRVLLGAVALLLALVLGILAGRALPTAPGENSVDVGFSRDMTTHHSQAVSMAYTAIQNAPTPEVRQLAVDIASTQGNQMGRMQQLLISWGQPLSGAGTPVMAWMAGTDLHARHLVEQEQEGRIMPGMATADELARLNSETGQVFEVDFLQLVLRHHVGGIEMAQYGAEHATTSEVRDLASAIASSQQGESDLLRDYLAARGAEPLPDEVAP